MIVSGRPAHPANLREGPPSDAVAAVTEEREQQQRAEHQAPRRRARRRRSRTATLMNMNDAPQMAGEDDQQRAVRLQAVSLNARDEPGFPMKVARSGPGLDGSLATVAEQPLHRALGLTDGELERIRDLLGRDPNDFELAVFSLSGPSTAGTSTLRSCSAAPVAGESASCRARRERRGDRSRWRRGRRLQGREPQPSDRRSSPSRVRPPESGGSCATSPRWAHAPSRSSTSCASARPTTGSTRGRGDRRVRELRRRANRRWRDRLPPGLRGQLPRQRHVRRPPAGGSRDARAARARRASRSSSTEPRRAATGSAAPAFLPARSWAREPPRSGRPYRSATRSPAIA